MKICPHCERQYDTNRSMCEACRKKRQREKTEGGVADIVGDMIAPAQAQSVGALSDNASDSEIEDKALDAVLSPRPVSPEVAKHKLSYEERLAAFKAMEFDHVEHVATHIPEFNELSIGGFPVGRATELFGASGVGKTTFMLQWISSLQGKRVLYIDTEGAANAERFASFDLDPHVFHIKVVNLIEEVYDLVLDALNIGNKVKHESYDIIIIDSLGGTSTVRDVEGEAGQGFNTGRAKVASQLFRVAVPRLGSTTMVVTNHEFHEVGGGKYAKVTTPCGEVKNYLFSLRIRLTTSASARFPREPKDGVFKGQLVTAKTYKTRYDSPGKSVEFKLKFSGDEE